MRFVELKKLIGNNPVEPVIWVILEEFWKVVLKSIQFCEWRFFCIIIQFCKLFWVTYISYFEFILNLAIYQGAKLPQTDTRWDITVVGAAWENSKFLCRRFFASFLHFSKVLKCWIWFEKISDLEFLLNKFQQSLNLRTYGLVEKGSEVFIVEHSLKVFIYFSSEMVGLSQNILKVESLFIYTSLFIWTTFTRRLTKVAQSSNCITQVASSIVIQERFLQKWTIIEVRLKCVFITPELWLGLSFPYGFKNLKSSVSLLFVASSLTVCRFKIEDWICRKSIGLCEFSFLRFFHSKTN